MRSRLRARWQDLPEWLRILIAMVVFPTAPIFLVLVLVFVLWAGCMQAIMDMIDGLLGVERVRGWKKRGSTLRK